MLLGRRLTRLVRYLEMHTIALIDNAEKQRELDKPFGSIELRITSGPSREKDSLNSDIIDDSSTETLEGPFVGEEAPRHCRAR